LSNKQKGYATKQRHKVTWGGKFVGDTGEDFIIHRGHVTSDKYLATGFWYYTKFFRCHLHDPDIIQGLHKIHNASWNYEFSLN